MARNLAVACDDILTAIDHVEETTGAMSLELFASDWRARYIVERALLIISEASRAIPNSLKTQHAEIRWVGVRDIGNVLRHQYATLSAPLIWNVIQDELPRLRRAIADIRTKVGR